ncbi:MAG: MazG nucleotide pyrophosphohydrolase domain-containing protein [Myxococcota bacterium]
MPELSTRPTLADYQRYVTALEHERGFAHQDVLTKCLLLGEEVGELFKAVRQQEGIAIDTPASPVAEELADVFIFICTIANRYNIDLEEAFRAKEAINTTRQWS